LRTCRSARLPYPEPAQQDVGADPRFQLVMNWSQLERALQVTEAAFSLEQILLPQGDVFRCQVGVGGRQQILAIKALLRGHLRPIVSNRPEGCCFTQPPLAGWSRSAH